MCFGSSSPAMYSQQTHSSQCFGKQTSGHSQAIRQRRIQSHTHTHTLTTTHSASLAVNTVAHSTHTLTHTYTHTLTTTHSTSVAVNTVAHSTHTLTHTYTHTLTTTHSTSLAHSMLTTNSHSRNNRLRRSEIVPVYSHLNSVSHQTLPYYASYGFTTL